MKKEKLHISYNEEGDLLEIRMGKATPSYMKPIGKGIFERRDEKTGKVKGFMILHFKKKGRNKFVDISLPIDLKTMA